MSRNTSIAVAFMLAGLTCAPLASAQEIESYGDVVSRKLSSSLANMSLSTLEFPKNIIIENNRNGVVMGVFGGIFEGVLHTMGRMSVGILDLVTAPLPTQPFVYPLYVWEDFDTTTSYGAVMRKENTQ